MICMINEISISGGTLFAIWALVNVLYFFSIIYKNKISIIEKIYNYQRAATYLILLMLCIIISSNSMAFGQLEARFFVAVVLVNIVIIIIEETTYNYLVADKL